MSDINLTTLTGRLVCDPIIRRADSGVYWGSFTLATNHHYKDTKGEFKEDTAFLTCKVFGRNAESMASRKKGETAWVAGRLKTETWEKEGANQSQLVLICDSVRFVTLLNGSKIPNSTAQAETGNGHGAGDDEDKPPF